MLVTGAFIFFAAGLLLIFLLRGFFLQVRLEFESRVKKLEDEVQQLLKEKKQIESDVSGLNSMLAKTVKIYEAARDICASLEEGELFSRFKKDLRGLMDCRECRFMLQDSFDTRKHPGGEVYRLEDKETRFGYLIIEGVSSADHSYLGILIKQFILGLKRARLYKKIQELAITDSLTGMFTRRYATERLEEEFKRSESRHLELSFLMIDVDNFKECNDKFGHLVGDMVLCEIANRVRENIREVDMLARFGGEEFMVFAPHTSKESARLMAERIRSDVEKEAIRAYDEKVKVTVSIGLASFPEDAHRLPDLLEKADFALYQAKGKGKNKIYVFGK